MNRIAKLSILLAAMFVSIDRAFADEKPTKPSKFEIRRAETEPADGLVEATVVGTDKKVYLHAMAELTERDVSEATSIVDSDKRPAIAMTLTKDGAKKMAMVSKEHLDKPLAIMVDGRVITAPVVRSELSDRITLTGSFSKAEVDKLVAEIGGKKPLP